MHQITYQFPGSTSFRVAERDAPDGVLSGLVVIDHQSGKIADEIAHATDAWHLTRVQHHGEVGLVA